MPGARAVCVFVVCAHADACRRSFVLCRRSHPYDAGTLGRWDGAKALIECWAAHGAGLRRMTWML